MSVRITTLAGSARQASLNKQLARILASRVDELGAIGQFVDLAGYPLPLYDGDLEAASGILQEAIALAQIVAGADGLIIASPEYNGAYSALLKNTVDWLTRVDRRLFVRPTAIVSASPGPRGGARGLRILRSTLKQMRVPLIEAELTVGEAKTALGGDVPDTDVLAAADTLITQLLAAVSALPGIEGAELRAEPTGGSR